ncbi:MAG: bifunctional DNA-binding transcriptional regulator/O6-methylguanine-DNA methyltransferase Ada [Acidobacteria bacterium]|nr:bifunctional DNA-binding transcriptional regulator/O6-methylguanine-DNA methyltransferase Ada [Acidobacteriota bacterium]MBS1866720.1 bifunctional DNA-binding transcriptional regulator/O6-methylguanine-DNA methyltransferase Ada [Acidobacteriota bacterium]
MAEQYWKATVARDSRSDGVFFLGVRSTRIYCRPSCPARRPLRRNVEFFKTQREAEQHGFRACLRCKPNEISASTALVQKSAALLAQSNEESPRLGVIARQLGTSTNRLRRAFVQVTGLAPRELAEALRLNRFKKLLRQGARITDALYETGYGSSSRVYERSNAQLGMTPATYQKGGKGMKLGYTIATAKLGKVLVAATERGVSAVYLGDSETKLLAELRDEFPKAEIAPARDGLGKYVKEIVSRTEGNPPRRELPLDLLATAFQRRVWRELQRIPLGKTRTYAQVAQSLGRPSASRAVARACATNPVSIVVPCHRVIRGDGNLAGYRWGIERKEQLLRTEHAEAGGAN